MRKSIGGLLGAILTIVMLSLFFVVSVASRNAPRPPAKATGPEDACSSNADCWCNSFNGAEFIPGQLVPGTCETNGRCALCIYE